MLKTVTITCNACDRNGMTGSEQDVPVRCFECGGRHRWEEKIDLNMNVVKLAGYGFANFPGPSEEQLDSLHSQMLPEFLLEWDE